MYLATDAFIRRHSLSRAEFLALDDKFGIVSFIAECPDIFDPMTGCPAVSGIRSAAVWSTDGAAADALSTAFFVMGEDAARTFSASLDFPVRAVFTDENGVTSRLGTP